MGLLFLCAVTDLSQQVAAEREARRVERTQALSTLVGGVAHDFNNLLTVISGGIDLARTGQGDPDEWLERSAAASAQASGLVRQLLRFSRPETDALEAVRLADVVSETVSLVRATFDRRMGIRLDVTAGDSTVQANRSQLEQVVMNLVVNARDAVLARLEESTEDAAGAAGAYAPVIAVSLGSDSEDPLGIILRVRDNGVGIPIDVVDRVFDPFFTTKGPDHGTGLGLATVHSIVRAHGGDVTVDSEVGLGAEFCVRLPLAASRAPSPPAPHVVGDRARHGRVLIVDDEEPVARVALRILTNAGMDASYALDGIEAVRQCREQFFDAILLDLNMPRPDGEETLTRLRAAAPRTPVIIVSGRLGAREVAETAGVMFLAKPYEAGDLVSLVYTAIEAHTAV